MEAATHMTKTATAEMADTYDAVVETHTVIDDGPPGTHPMAEAVAAAVPAISTIVVGIAVGIGIVVRGTAEARIGH